MNWKEHSDRKRVKTLLAMGFIPTWLEELLQEGDKLYSENERLSKIIHRKGDALREHIQKKESQEDG